MAEVGVLVAEEGEFEGVGEVLDGEGHELVAGALGDALAGRGDDACQDDFLALALIQIGQGTGGEGFDLPFEALQRVAR